MLSAAQAGDAAKNANTASEAKNDRSATLASRALRSKSSYFPLKVI
jgi:hypothetical protein